MDKKEKKSICSVCGSVKPVRQPCLGCWYRRAQPDVTCNIPPGPRRLPVTRGTLVVAHTDLIAWLTYLAQLPVFGGRQSRLVRWPAALRVRKASRQPRSRLAFASYDRHLIQITAYPGIAQADVLESLLHEVVHLSSIRLRRHDSLFKRTLARAAYEAFGIDGRMYLKGATWKLDQALVKQLADKQLSLRPTQLARFRASETMS